VLLLALLIGHQKGLSDEELEKLGMAAIFHDSRRLDDEDNIHTKKAVFELYFRKLPFGNGYAIFAGLERIIDYLQTFRFSESDLEYLKELGYQEDLLTSYKLYVLQELFVP
jgi:hypothetical protein